MATNFPTSLDTFTNPTSGNTLDSPSHSGQHSDINDAVEAIEAKLGIGSSTAGSAVNGYALVSTSGGTTSWTTIGTAGISSGAATNGQVLTANGSGGVSYTSLSTSGLVLLNTTSFSAVTSVSLAQGTFSATYNHYKLIINGSSTAGGTTVRFRTSGTDNSNASYARQFLDATSTTVAGNRVTGQTSIATLDLRSVGSTLIIDIFNPFATAKTTLVSQIAEESTGLYVNVIAALFDATTSFDSMSFIQSGGGTITGTYSVYGYNK